MCADDNLGLGDIFQEPPRPPTPPPTSTVYRRKLNKQTNPTWTSIQLQLVGHHVLWAQHLWNAAIVLADFLDSNSDTICKDRSVLELGAGGALPSIVTALCGAREVVITDYPDLPLIENINRNVDYNVSTDIKKVIKVEGFIWGTGCQKLLGSAISEDTNSQDVHIGYSQGGFDVIILSDLIFNHSQHAALLDTCESTLRPYTEHSPQTRKTFSSNEGDAAVICPCVLVFFSHHRPQYATRDLEFFSLATRRGWHCEKIVETKMPVMFPDDQGDEQVRSTVYGWALRRLPE